MDEVILTPACERCGARLVLRADRHELSQPATFAVHCPRCGARVRLASTVGPVRSLSAPGPNAA
jgi:DNA-directed RNA polymerase subunit RPC12/RpoP